jgi:hypothetical protein
LADGVTTSRLPNLGLCHVGATYRRRAFWGVMARKSGLIGSMMPPQRWQRGETALRNSALDLVSVWPQTLHAPGMPHLVGFFGCFFCFMAGPTDPQNVSGRQDGMCAHGSPAS